MSYKLVCIDMDGTLLNSYGKVSEVSKKALKKAHDMGVHIVISTGRMYTDAESYSNMIGLRSPIIVSNGALVKEKGSEEVITIGDSENDLSMIEYAGMGIAMENAIAIAKNKADYITDTNNNDGVAKTIYRFILN